VLQRENVSLSTNGRGITVRGRLVSFETIVECNYVRIMHAKCYRLYRLTRRNRNAFPITVTELNVIAALAIMGLSSNPKKG